MPPPRKFLRQDIIDVSFEIVRKEGLDELNARRIAHELHASVQPIFHNFHSMEELKHIIYDKIDQTYHDYMMCQIKNENPYKQMGLAYIRFAKEEPKLFQILFMQKKW